MKTIKTMHLRVENFTLKKKLSKLEKQHKEDTELINYLSAQLYNELAYEIHSLKDKVNKML